MTNPNASTDALTSPLQGRQILLGVCGGIAAYKSADLVRRLRESGAEVQVVMTASAREFVGEATFQALSGRPVRGALWDAAAEAAMGHIELARWPDLILIAPASANTLARLAHGMADDLLSTLCLATDRPLAVAPAMNRLMWANAATQANLRTLIERGVRVFGPGEGSQACGETGEGRMWEPLQLRDALASMLSAGPLRGVCTVVTAGPTREPIDPVRYISNRSSGKMGYALASALAAPAGVTRIDVETAQQMLDATLAAAQGAQIVVGTAAVADYRAEQVAAHKIKKHADAMVLPLVKNADVLAEVRARFPAVFLVGFAAETERLAEHAQEKMRRKQLDMIAANWVGEGVAFDQDHNALQVCWPGGERELPRASKTALAQTLATLIAERYAQTRTSP